MAARLRHGSLSRLGDRFVEAPLDSFIRSKNQLPRSVDLLVLRTVDIDAHLENAPSSTSKSIRVAVHKLKQAGFADVVIATDHGFALNAHAEAGDVCARPAGVWTVVHDRALLGEGEPDAANFVLPAEKVGVHGDFAKFGGASLQEAVVPVISVALKRPKQPELGAAKVSLFIQERRQTGTTRLPVVDLAVEGANMFSLGETFEILLQAYNKKGDVVGEAKGGGPIDVAPGTVTVKPGGKVQVTVKMAEEFEGKFMLKALNPVTMAQYASLDLETDYAV